MNADRMNRHCVRVLAVSMSLLAFVVIVSRIYGLPLSGYFFPWWMITTAFMYLPIAKAKREGAPV